jgi:TolB protein
MREQIVGGVCVAHPAGKPGQHLVWRGAFAVDQPVRQVLCPGTGGLKGHGHERGGDYGQPEACLPGPADGRAQHGDNGNVAARDQHGQGADHHGPRHDHVDDGFGTLSPDGKKIVFDSNRTRLAGEPANTSGLFVMNADGTDQTFLVRGGSPTWSPDGKYIAFHASASGTGAPINNNPGAATVDSDIFIVNVDDLLEHGTPPRNLTNSPDAVDDDPDWSPDGNFIAYTSHDATQRPVPPMPLDYTTAEIYVRAADGTGSPTRLTTNTVEERAAAWSHAGDRIAYRCRSGSPRFSICTLSVDGTDQTKLTTIDLPALTPTWSPDDGRVFFHRPWPEPSTSLVRQHLWWVPADGTMEQLLVPADSPTGNTLFADVGALRINTNN